MYILVKEWKVTGFSEEKIESDWQEVIEIDWTEENIEKIEKWYSFSDWNFVESNTSKENKKIEEANIILDLELKKLKADSIQDWATAQTKFDKSLKEEAWKRKIALRDKANELQGIFNKKYYWAVYSEEGNKFVQDLVINSYLE